MSIPVPKLDDRSFPELLAAARERMQQVDPQWTDLSVHDPGIVLVEAFAHLTDILLYRLNRVPERLYAEFLNLLGTSVHPPGAATTTLVFSRPTTGPAIRIPRGTRVTTPPGPPGTPVPVFSTVAEALLDEGETSVPVAAADVVLHDATPVGVGTGGPGQSARLSGAPLVDGPTVSIGIEVPPGVPLPSGAAVMVDGRRFQICREVQVFADARPDEAVCRVDRSTGIVTFPWFPPGEAGPRVPAGGSTILAWYRTGGGERGNLPAASLTVLRDPLPGSLTVTNPEPAAGGREAEPLESALRRGPQEFQARDRAVTARDYQVLAARHGAIDRAGAYTRREVWPFAERGQVEVVLVPHVPHAQRPGGAVTSDALAAQARDEVRDEVTAYLSQRATVGAEPVVQWARYKEVLVDARVVVRPDEDPTAVRARILRRLADIVTPLPPPGTDVRSGFGQPLRVSNLYRALEQAEPGVRYVDRLRLEVAEVPDTEAVALTRADGGRDTWFVGQGETLFRTTNAGDGWEACSRFPGEQIRAVAPWPAVPAGRAVAATRPGLVAIATDAGDGGRVHVSDDLGTTWRQVADLGFGLRGLTWVDRDGTAVLLVCGENGLYELVLAPGAVPVQNLVDPAQPDRGFHAVVAFVDIRGRTGVAVAAEAAGGVWLSPEAGAPQTFRQIRGPGEEIRCLSVQYDGPAAFVWAGRAVPDGDGSGCLRLRVDELGRVDAATASAGWEDLAANWTGGSCWDVQVIGGQVVAATQSGGVLRLPLGQPQLVWQAPDVNCGLPLRDRRRFRPVYSVSGALDPGGRDVLFAAGVGGVHRSLDGGAQWRSASSRTVDDLVTIPAGWLFCSGAHRVEVVTDDD